MAVEDVYTQNRRLWVRSREKGGKGHAMPCHHNLDEHLVAYLDRASLRDDPMGSLFRTIGRGTDKLTRTALPQANAYAMCDGADRPGRRRLPVDHREHRHHYPGQAHNDTTPAGRIMMQMVGFFAEFERVMIRERTSAGLAAARAEGRVGGRRKQLDAAKRREIAESVITGRKSGPRWRACTTSASQPCHGSSPGTGWPAHSSWVIPKSGRSRGARDANLERATLESCPKNLDEGPRPRSVAG